jgi:hypothetical protein
MQFFLFFSCNFLFFFVFFFGFFCKSTSYVLHHTNITNQHLLYHVWYHCGLHILRVCCLYTMKNNSYLNIHARRPLPIWNVSTVNFNYHVSISGWMNGRTDRGHKKSPEMRFVFKITLNLQKIQNKQKY